MSFIFDLQFLSISLRSIPPAVTISPLLSADNIVNVKVASFEVSTKKADASNLYEFVSEEKKDI